MTTVKIEPSPLQGNVYIPPSKSMSHRAVICAGLADGVSKIENVVFSEDIAATLEAMKVMGTELLSPQGKIEDSDPKTLTLKGTSNLKLASDIIHCRESGSTLRFLIPLASKTGEKVTFTGQGKLGERPLDVYYKMFDEQEIVYQTSGGFLPLTLQGSLKPGIYSLKGNISSQFISGLMFLLPLLDGDSKVIVTTELESRGYVDLTMAMQAKFGIEIENKDYQEFSIRGNQIYQPADYRVEGDYSQAAFWIVAAILGGEINCLDLTLDSLQGDKAILDIVQAMGAKIVNHTEGIRVYEGLTQGIVIDAGQCPDLVPILSVLAALSKGTTQIVNAARLRIKESDRLTAMATELNKLGANIKEMNDGLLIEGVESLQGGTVDSWNDHRIAMALAVASIRCKYPVIITGSEAVKKSYPHFWIDFAKLGGSLS